jgi:uncharacterized protein (DUF885 family)
VKKLIVVAFFCACATMQPETSSIRLKQIADDYWHRALEQSPYLQIKFDAPTRHLPDVSYAQAERDAQFARSLLRRLEAIDPAALNDDERITLAMLRWNNQQTVDDLRYFWFRFPVTPYAFRSVGFNEIFTQKRLSGAERLRLLQEVPRVADQLIGVLQQERQRGILLPKPEIVLVRETISGLIRDPEKSLFLGDGAGTPEANAIREAIANQVNPALHRLVDVFSTDYEQRAPAEIGVSQYPGGAEAYQHFVRERTTVDLTPQQIHELGLREVERINGEMQQVRDALGFKGTKAEFHQFLKTDPRFFAKAPEEVGERLTAYLHKIEPHVPAFFVRTPKAAYDVQRLNPAMEGSITFGYYQAPTATDPVGHYYYNGSKLNERNLLFAPALIAHELIPGHHFQIARQEENDRLPLFRRESFSTAFVEGWGEYAAALGNDMGTYADPYDRYGRLTMDMMLSVRLVVDTGMNALLWSRQRAADFMRENTLLSDTEIATETLRYAVDMPAQALAYKIGSLKMMELRQKTQQELGPRFDIKEFHEWIIGSGSMPLPILEQHVAARVKRRPSA